MGTPILSEKDLLLRLALSDSTEQNDRLSASFEGEPVDYIDIAAFTFTRARVYEAIQAVPDSDYIDLANCTLSVSSYSWPPSPPSSGGKVSFGEWVVRGADPARYKRLIA